MIGDLDRRITLQDATTAADSYGQRIETWVDTVTVWASIRFGSGSERIAANKLTSFADCIFRIRYRTGVTEQTRIKYGTDYYDIQHIAEIDRRRYLDLTAKRVE